MSDHLEAAAAGRSLLGLLRPHPEPALVSAVDWHGAMPLLDLLGLSPLIAYRLRDTGLERHLPPEVRDDLRRRYLATAARNARGLSALASIGCALTAAGVPALVYKGAALVATVYPTLGCRPMADVDLLVPAEQATAALATLRTLGYGVVTTGRPDSRRMGLGGQVLLVTHGGPASGVRVDLHWQLFTDPWLAQAFPLDVAGVWQRATPHVVDRASLLRPSPADELLLLCLHLALHHGFAGALPYVDIDAVIRAGCPWPTFVARAHACGACALCWLALARAVDWFGTPVPGWVLATLAPGGPRRALISALVGPATLESAAQQLTGGPRERLVHLSLLERPGALPALLRRALWPGLDYLEARFGGGRPAALALALLWPAWILWRIARTLATPISHAPRHRAPPSPLPGRG